MKSLNDLVTSAPMSRYFLGFDTLLNDMARRFDEPANSSYPPINVVKMKDGSSRIEIAVAGFAKEDIDVVLEGDRLTVGASKTVDEAVDEGELYLSRGISSRSWKHTWRLSSNTEVNSVSLKDGILRIVLIQVVPEELKPRRLTIL